MAQNDLDLMFRIHESMNVLINSHLVSDHHSSSSPAAKASWCIYSSFSNLNASKICLNQIDSKEEELSELVLWVSSIEA